MTTRQKDIIDLLHNFDYFYSHYDFRKMQVLEILRKKYKSLRMIHIEKAIQLEYTNKPYLKNMSIGKLWAN